VQVDMSRAHWDVATFEHLLALAKECRLADQAAAMLAGEHINHTENRAVLHTALRAPRGQAQHSELVHTELDRFLAFADQIRAQAGGNQAGDIHDVVCLGIGGSYLGPQMVVSALQAYAHPALNLHFVSNVDGQALAQVFSRIQAKHTLFVVVSKTFTTAETLANAQTAKQWFIDQGETNVAQHFVACTTAVDAAQAFGITTTFAFWDWVGGRYSMWSSVGLSVALAIGSQAFRGLLAGAHAMDQHFANTPLAQNVPVCLGLMDVWYRNFMGYGSKCISPYLEGLCHLPAYLQQLVMESNGKSVDRQGQALPYQTSDVIWGATGTNGQHAFFQMLHQGTQAVPVEFILAKAPVYSSSNPLSDAVKAQLLSQHQALLANALAQARTLMTGRPQAELGGDVNAAHRVMPGNRPSISLLLDQLTPAALGALVALYEHRTFVSGALWGINSFDQWGVEAGKAMCKTLLPLLASDAETQPALAAQINALDGATAAMIRRLR
jgi:glucose-6-phosphate isomerase